MTSFCSASPNAQTYDISALLYPRTVLIFLVVFFMNRIAKIKLGDIDKGTKQRRRIL